jgi:cysteine dioxygenase
VKETPWYELVVLCWRSGQRTPIHDHQGSSCAFKVIEGVASETRFVRTDSGLICPAGTKRLEAGYVCAAWDSDIHQVANLELVGKDLVTLHIYSPPFRYYNKYSLDSPNVERADRMEELYDGGAGV